MLFFVILSFSRSLSYLIPNVSFVVLCRCLSPQAVACFRMAIRTDRRHYNAWYGLGSIYHRQEKYDMAEYHFRRALRINPQSRYINAT